MLPLKKVTVPVGPRVLTLLVETVAVKVTGVPSVTVIWLEVTAVEVAA